MKRTIDSLTGEGEIAFKSGKSLPVRYALRVDQEMLTAIPGEPPLPGLFEVTGYIDVLEGFLDLEDDLVLTLNDGIELEVFVSGGDMLSSRRRLGIKNASELAARYKADD